MSSLTTAQVPYTGPYSVSGNGKHKGPTALALKRTMKRSGHGFQDVTFDELDDVFNNRLEEALDKAFKDDADGYGEGRWKKVRALKLADGTYAMDSISRKMIRDEYAKTIPVVPNLGPIYNGGVSILQQDLTHDTDGLPRTSNGTSLWPAFDSAFGVGVPVIAPENLKVTKSSSASPGDAFYAAGSSGIDYWFGHLVSAPSVGRVFKKGEVMGKTARNHTGGGPHCHCAINVERIWGKGKYLEHHTNYTHGAPLVGAQLKLHAML